MQQRIVNPPGPSVHEYAAWTLAVLAILFVLVFHLLPALVAGLLVYELARLLAPRLRPRVPPGRARTAAVGLVALIVIGAITAAGFGIAAFVESEGGGVSAVVAKMAEILESSRASLPKWIADYLPSGVDQLREDLSFWLREHAAELQLMGKSAGHTLVHVLIGMVIGAMVSMLEPGGNAGGPLARALGERVFRLGEAFRRVVFAQVRISAINTAFTAIFLAVVLPLFGVHLPLTKTMIVVTFIAGLLPVIGNLISNSMIFVISLVHSPAIAVVSLVYLVVIHKLEYFLNARIVGAQISARAWELLTAMLLLETAFGLAGLAAAPICYAWLKDELTSRGLI
jgi:predicted PurR-regulated permease PerM